MGPCARARRGSGNARVQLSHPVSSELRSRECQRLSTARQSETRERTCTSCKECTTEPVVEAIGASETSSDDALAQHRSSSPCHRLDLPRCPLLALHLALLLIGRSPALERMLRHCALEPPKLGPQLVGAPRVGLALGREERELLERRRGRRRVLLGKGGLLGAQRREGRGGGVGVGGARGEEGGDCGGAKSAPDRERD